MRTSRRLTAVLAAFLGIALLGATTSAAAPDRVRPLANAHAHNDYEHARPLFDALDQGFTSVEADIYLVGGQLLVGHDEADLRPERTLEALYLEPLRRQVLAHHGHVHARPAEFQLLVDVKSEAESIYSALEKRLRDPRYSFLFSSYSSGHVREQAVTAVLSGNRPKDTLLAKRYRLAFYDGRVAEDGDLGPGSDRRVAPLVSGSWEALFSWRGEGRFPAAEHAKLAEIVRTAHAAGQRVRFWATPDEPGPARAALWRELVKAGVDYLNTDDLAGLAAFLKGLRDSRNGS